MLDISPDIAPPHPVRLADYRPPAFLIDTVDLVFELGAEDTRVKSRLGIRRNPAVAERGAALHLDGEALELVSLALDGEPLGANRYQLEPEGGLILADVPDAFTLDVETRIAPAEQYRALRSLRVGRQFLHAVRAGGLSPHHLFHRSARCDGALHDDDHVAEKARYPVLLVNGNPVEHGAYRRTAAIGPNGSIRTPSPPTSLPLSPATWLPLRTALRRARARMWRWPSGCAAATRTNAATRWPR